MIGEGDPNPTTALIHPEATSEDQSSLKSSGETVLDHTSLPEDYVPIIDDPYSIAPPLSLTTGGWIEEPNGRRIFWVPENLRADFDTAGRTVLLGMQSKVQS